MKPCGGCEGTAHDLALQHPRLGIAVIGELLLKRTKEGRSLYLKIYKLPKTCYTTSMRRFDKGDLLNDYKHPNQQAYAGQRIMVVNIDDYAYLVPYVESESELFLKTIIPSRKATRQYIGEKR